MALGVALDLKDLDERLRGGPTREALRVKGVPSVFLGANATPWLQLVLCGIANTWQAPVQAASSHSQSRSGICRIAVAAPPHSGICSPRNMTLRCRWPAPGGMPDHSYAVKVVKRPGS